MSHFLDLADAGPDGIAAILKDAAARKAARAGWPKGRVDADAPLAGQVLAMIFEKNSTRTRVSFDMAMRQLGGSALITRLGLVAVGARRKRGRHGAGAVGLCRRNHDPHRPSCQGGRTGRIRHVPVINGLTDASHPCQLLADMQAVIERKGALAGTRWAWLGDGNNVCHSLIEAGSLMGFEVRVACPAGHDPDADVLTAAAHAA